MWAVARGLVDLDAPVARYWPEFAADDKGDIPVRWLLTHEAGLPAIAKRMPRGSLSDWEAMTTALAAQAPWWEPGTAHGYHGVTFGHLIGEVLRRATRRDCGELIRDELAAPLGIELCMPLPAGARRAHRRPRRRRCHPTARSSIAGTRRPSLGPAAFGNPPDCNDPAHCMTDAFRRAVIPAANLHANARGLDRLYACSLPATDPPSELDLAPASLVEEFGRCHVRGDDKVMELPTAFGLGFEHTIPEWQFGPGARTYGHNGSGGSLGLVDPDAADLARLRDEPLCGGDPTAPIRAGHRSSTRCTPRSESGRLESRVLRVAIRTIRVAVVATISRPRRLPRW